MVGEGGLRSLTMAALAKRLDVGVMSLYWYFPSKEDLLAAVATRAQGVLSGRASFEPGRAWDEFLVAYFTHLHDQILEVPGLGEVLLSHGRVVTHEHPESALAALDALLQAMLEAGFGPDVAARGIEALSQYTLGFSMRELARHEQGAAQDQLAVWEATLDRLEQGTSHPALRTAIPFLALAGDADQFEFGLRLLLDGLRRHVAPPPREA
jgi:AcrR family transcriptional regulator